VRLSFIEALLRADHVGVAWVERQRVTERLPSLHDLLDLELPHLATSFSNVSARAIQLMTVQVENACYRVRARRVSSVWSVRNEIIRMLIGPGSAWRVEA
jgi:hypothetical protein